MSVFKATNLGLRFVLELCMLAGLAVAGHQLGSQPAAKIVLAIAVPLLAAVVWGLFVSPRAAVPVPRWLWYGIQLVLFGAATAGLVAAGYALLGAVFGVLVIANLLALMLVPS